HSLIITALSDISGSRNSLLSKVVLPLPRKPVITETGSRLADLSGSNRFMARLRKVSFEKEPSTRDHVVHLAAELGRANMGEAEMNRDMGPPRGDRRDFLKTAGLGAAGMVAGTVNHGSWSTPAQAQTMQAPRLSEQKWWPSKWGE